MYMYKIKMIRSASYKKYSLHHKQILSSITRILGVSNYRY